MSDIKELRKSLLSSKRAKPDNRWTLLFIGDSGRVITLKRFKALVILILVALTVAVAGVVTLFFLNQKIIQKNSDMRTRLEAATNQMKQLRHEKDILLARVVLSETKLKAKNPLIQGKTKDAAVKAPVAIQPEKAAEPDRKTRKVEIAKPEPAADVAAKPSPAVVSADSPAAAQPAEVPVLSVALEDFEATHLTAVGLLEVKFKIKNTTADLRKVAGHAIVVLKSDNLPQNEWVTLPTVSLVDGKPTGKRKGKTFSISFFRAMKYSRKVPGSPERFDTAEVFVFTNEGKFLLAQTFPLKLPPIPKPAAAKPAQTEPPAKTKQAGPSSGDMPDALIDSPTKAEQVPPSPGDVPDALSNPPVEVPLD